MKWTDIPLNPTASVLRQFAGAWLVFFSAIGIHQWLNRGNELLGQTMIGLALIFGLLGLIKPQAIRWLFVVAMALAFPIGWVVSQLVLAIIFYLVITPVALFFRLRRRDLLARKPAPDQISFWSEKITPGDARRYLRQY
jgi:hypothetical protein